MARKITKKQKAFADKFIETGNGTKSALAAYDTKDPNTAASIAVENLGKPKVIQYLEENAIGAASRVVKLSQKAKNEAVRLAANKDILDRAGFKPKDAPPPVPQGPTYNLFLIPKVNEATTEYEARVKALLAGAQPNHVQAA